MIEEPNSGNADEESGPTVLPNNTTVKDLELDTEYLGRVIETKDYGVFVGLDGPASSDDWYDVAGLVHRSNLSPMRTIHDFSEGDQVIVEVNQVKSGGDVELDMVDDENIGASSPVSAPQTDDVDYSEVNKELLKILREMQDQSDKDQISEAIQLLKSNRGKEVTLFSKYQTEDEVRLQITLED